MGPQTQILAFKSATLKGRASPVYAYSRCLSHDGFNLRPSFVVHGQRSYIHAGHPRPDGICRTQPASRPHLHLRNIDATARLEFAALGH